MVKLIKILILFSILSLLLVGCSKKEIPPSNFELNLNHCNYSSQFKVYKEYSVNENNLYLLNCKPDVLIWKKCPSQFSNNPPSQVDLTEVSLNTIPLTLSFQNYWTLIYQDTLSKTLNPPLSWNIIGDKNYPSFTVNINDSFPEFYNYSILPDTISTSQLNLIYLNGKNATNISVRIENNVGGVDPISKFNNQYLCAEPSITTSSISFIGPRNYSNSNVNYLVIEYSKVLSQVIENKTIYFIVSSIYKKKIALSD
jgi:hypothetical protein